MTPYRLYYYKLYKALYENGLQAVKNENIPEGKTLHSPMILQTVAMALLLSICIHLQVVDSSCKEEQVVGPILNKDGDNERE